MSINTVAFIKREFDKCDKDWEDIEAMNDNEIYTLFYPHKFIPRNRFAPVDYSYIHKELPKTRVISHPKHGGIILNDSYLLFGEHYQIAIIPAAVKKQST